MLTVKDDVKALREEMREMGEIIETMYKVLVALTLATKEFLPTLYSEKRKTEAKRRLKFAKKTLLELQEKMGAKNEGEKGTI